MTRTKRNILLSIFSAVVVAMLTLCLAFGLSPKSVSAAKHEVANSPWQGADRVITTTTNDSNVVGVELVTDSSYTSTRAYQTTPLNINMNHLYLELEITQMNKYGGIWFSLFSSPDGYPMGGHGEGLGFAIYDETAWGYPEFTNLRMDPFKFIKSSSTMSNLQASRLYGSCQQTDPLYYDPSNEVYPKIYVHAWADGSNLTAHWGTNAEGVANGSAAAGGVQIALSEFGEFNPAECYISLTSYVDGDSNRQPTSIASNNKLNVSAYNLGEQEVKSLNLSNGTTDIDSDLTSSVDLASYFSTTKFYGQTEDVAISYSSNDSNIATVEGSILTFNRKATGVLTATATCGSLTKDVVFNVTYSGFYDIAYNLDGGEVDGENPATYKESDDAITLINPTKENYTFAGWTGTGLTEPTMEVTIPQGTTGDRSYTATWTANAVSLTATYSEDIVAGNKINPSALSISINYADNSNGGVSPLDVEYWYDGQQITDPANYVFTEQMVGIIPVIVKYNGLETTMNLNIVSAIVNYDITYNLDGGEVATANPVTYNENTASFTLVNPTKENYTFAGWTGTGLTEPTMEVVIEQGSTGDRSYTATWTANAVSLTANYSENIVAGNKINPSALSISINYADNSNGEVNPLDVEYWYGGQQITDPANYVFTEQMVGELDIIVKYQGLETTMTVTVVSAIVNYDITYNLDGGEVATANPVTYNENTASFTLVNPTKEGYTFKGWTGTGLTEPTMEVTIEQGSTGDRSYTATWEENTQDGGDPVTPPPAGDDNDGGDQTPDTTPDTTPEETPKEGGCGSVIGVGALIPAMVAVLGAGLVVKAKKKD